MGQSGSRDVLLDAAQRRLGTHGSAAEKVWEGISHVRNGQHDGKAVHAIPAEALAAHLGLEAAACQRLIAGAAQDLLPGECALPVLTPLPQRPAKTIPKESLPSGPEAAQNSATKGLVFSMLAQRTMGSRREVATLMTWALAGRDARLSKAELCSRLTPLVLAGLPSTSATASSTGDSPRIQIYVEYWAHGLTAGQDYASTSSLSSGIAHHVSLFNVLCAATRALDLSPREEDQIVLPPTTADLLSPEAAFIINANLAGPLQNQWHLLYSSARDGSSFATFSGRITQAGATVLVFRDKQGHVFGGFAPESWSVQPQFFGSNATFLFKLEPELRLYEASGLNDHFMYMNQGMKTMPNGLGFGGQLNYFALYVDAALTNGHSKGKPSTTFKSPSLAASEDFVIDACEAWRVGPSPEQAAGQKSILDGRHEEEALLEMAGRTLHSKQLREPHPEDDE